MVRNAQYHSNVSYHRLARHVSFLARPFLASALVEPIRKRIDHQTLTRFLFTVHVCSETLKILNTYKSTLSLHLQFEEFRLSYLHVHHKPLRQTISCLFNSISAMMRIKMQSTVFNGVIGYTCSSVVSKSNLDGNNYCTCHHVHYILFTCA